MFCIKCGKNVDASKRFCPYCGSEMRSVSVGNVRYMNNSVSGGGTNPPDSFYNMTTNQQKKPKKSSNRKILFVGTGIVITILLVVAIIFGVSKMNESKEQYSIVGEWECDMQKGLNVVFYSLLTKQCGLSHDWAENIIDFLGIDSIVDFSLIFTDSGQIYICKNGMTLSLGDLSYEESVGDLQLNYQLSVKGISIPVSAGYRADYKVTKNKLTLDFFGEKLIFSRID